MITLNKASVGLYSQRQVATSEFYPYINYVYGFIRFFMRYALLPMAC